MCSPKLRFILLIKTNQAIKDENKISICLLITKLVQHCECKRGNLYVDIFTTVCNDVDCQPI